LEFESGDEFKKMWEDLRNINRVRDSRLDAKEQLCSVIVFKYR